ncbi:hypothetical protein KUTeg_022349 [Tegillarca granosa]|uniref:BTB domain-containing protein n=1 Tax=Tegillarca granosa TaxID=220873 RepID=A0ABQ9E6R1_TEGGR|nr:hypothetical protein KUTeg_022349 [Tegillarca granosa]
MADRVIKVNVGGMVYTTTKSTLTKIHGSNIWRIFTGDVKCLKDERGTYFLDRDGPVFRFILNYLRSSKLITPQGYRELHLLREEADYYGLDELVAEINKILASRRRKNRKRFRKGISRSLGSEINICDESGSVLFSDDSSEWFYD